MILERERGNPPKERERERGKAKEALTRGGGFPSLSIHTLNAIYIYIYIDI